jgi:hypothetical protein
VQRLQTHDAQTFTCTHQQGLCTVKQHTRHHRQHHTLVYTPHLGCAVGCSSLACMHGSTLQHNQRDPARMHVCQRAAHTDMCRHAHCTARNARVLPGLTPAAMAAASCSCCWGVCLSAAPVTHTHQPCSHVPRLAAQLVEVPQLGPLPLHPARVSGHTGAAHSRLRLRLRATAVQHAWHAHEHLIHPY